VWAPSTEGSAQHLVFVGWTFETRKLGIKYCYNRPCALYVVKAPHHESKANETEIQCVTSFLIFLWKVYFFVKFGCAKL